MKEIEKLFQKINKKDRLALLQDIKLLVSRKHKSTNIKKLQGSDFYRFRKGNFRIIFHYEGKQVIIDSVRLKGEDMYKDFI